MNVPPGLKTGQYIAEVQAGRTNTPLAPSDLIFRNTLLMTDTGGTKRPFPTAQFSVNASIPELDGFQNLEKNLGNFALCSDANQSTVNLPN